MNHDDPVLRPLQKGRRDLQLARDYSHRKDEGNTRSLLAKAIKRLREAIHVMGEGDGRRAAVEADLDEAIHILDGLDATDRGWTCVEQKKIKDGATGYGFEKVFAKALLPSIKQVEVVDSYIRTESQVEYFTRLCEILLRRCPCCRLVSLKTFPEAPTPTFNQANALQNLKRDLDQVLGGLPRGREGGIERGVTLTLEMDRKCPHNRHVTLTEGGGMEHMFTLDRGLDIYQPRRGFSIGSFDLNLRPCKDADIVYYTRCPQ